MRPPCRDMLMIQVAMGDVDSMIYVVAKCKRSYIVVSWETKRQYRIANGTINFKIEPLLIETK